MHCEPFTVAVPQADIDALHARLAATRWAPEWANDDWSYGVNGTYLRELVRYWREDFDWRTQERAINTFAQFRTEIDGVPIHFVHVRGKGAPGGPAPRPIVLTHGWPWTFWDFRQVIGPLADPAAYGGDPADAFDVVVPSLPGFTFSTPLPTAGIGYRETAALWVQLMHGLGYDKFFAHGGDSGAFVSAWLGHAHAEAVSGIHLNFPVIPGVGYGAFDPAEFPPEERAMFDAQDVEGRHHTHLMVHIHEPQTLAWAMHDSPAGQAAWMLHRRRAWSDCHGDVESRFDRDTLLTHLSLIWFTDSFAQSLHFYRASGFHQGMPLAHSRQPAIPVPTAIAVLPRELAHLPRSLVAAHCDLRQWTVFPSGGHFAAAEEPERIVADIRHFARPLRG
jgi:pimeloyl-ACP methyl ester carboxylesterase